MKAPTRIVSVDDIDFLREMETQDEATIDLTQVRLIRPVGIVAILAAIERRSRLSTAKIVHFLAPSSETVKAYMLHTGMFDVMREFGDFEGLQPEAQILDMPPLHPMVKCAHFTTEYDIEQLVARMQDEFQASLRHYATLAPACQLFLSELATNVVYHAQSNGGYVLAQLRSDPVSRPVVEIAVADCGIGIRESLKENPDHAAIENDGQALQHSITEGVSRLRDPYRGYGFHHITNNIKEPRNRTMTIRSGTSALIMTGGVISLAAPRAIAYNGTLVSVTIPC